MIDSEEALSTVERGFVVLEHSGEDSPSFKVQPRYSHSESFNTVMEELRHRGIYPFYRQIDNDYYLTLASHSGKEVELPAYAHFLLFIATLVTVSLAGYLHWADGKVMGSLFFAAALMGILMTHELGHYVQAKIKRTKATLPFFIPVPPNIFPFGTMGAVITMGEPLRDRSTLVRVGIAGPLAGFILALPVLYYGLMHSTLMPVEEAYAEDELVFIMPLAMQLISKLIFGQLSQDMSIEPHPLAMAGWIGLFVTALNLIPLGQLDGGHVLRALFPRKHAELYRGVFILLIATGLFIWPGWLMWALVVYVLTRLKHPGPLNDVSGISRGEKLIGIVYIVVMSLSFIPTPFVPAESLQAITR